MDGARELFESLVTGGYETILSLLESDVFTGQEENNFIDFKRKAHPGISGAERSDRQTYAVALSGFSNTDGGVIVWGVDCRGSSDKADVPRHIEPISFLTKFLTDLNSNTSQAIVPVNPGVENVRILLPGEIDKGLIVTYIPKSDTTPHRALNAMDKYYLRIGDSFFTTPHSTLEDMFGKRHRPLIKLEHKLIVTARDGGNNPYIRVQIGIHNSGRHVALYPAIGFKLSKQWQPKSDAVLVNTDRTWKQMSVPLINITPGFNGEIVWSGGINDAIHPTTTKHVMSLERLVLGAEIVLESDETTLFEGIYTLYAQDCMPVSGKLTICADEIRREVFS